MNPLDAHASWSEVVGRAQRTIPNQSGSICSLLFRLLQSPAPTDPLIDLPLHEPPVGPLVHEEISSRLTDVTDEWLDLVRSNKRNHVEKLLAKDSNALLSSLDLAVVLSAVKPDSDIND